MLLYHSTVLHTTLLALISKLWLLYLDGDWLWLSCINLLYFLAFLLIEFLEDLVTWWLCDLLISSELHLFCFSFLWIGMHDSFVMSLCVSAAIYLQFFDLLLLPLCPLRCMGLLRLLPKGQLHLMIYHAGTIQLSWWPFPKFMDNPLICATMGWPTPTMVCQLLNFNTNTYEIRGFTLFLLLIQLDLGSLHVDAGCIWMSVLILKAYSLKEYKTFVQANLWWTWIQFIFLPFTQISNFTTTMWTTSKRPSKACAGNAADLPSGNVTSSSGYRWLHQTLPPFHMASMHRWIMTTYGLRFWMFTTYLLVKIVYTWKLTTPRAFLTKYLSLIAH